MFLMIRKASRLNRLFGNEMIDYFAAGAEEKNRQFMSDYSIKS
jgi:hypothetical protein